jgi:CBS domain containing-hemolysin-like protein
MNIQRPRSAAGRAATAALLALSALLSPSVAQASFLPPEMMDAAATYIAWFVIIVMPIAGIVIFWLLHILPEKVAEKRHHPQRDAIQVLCLLSLLFGGLLWPLAWLWAYTRPTGYRLAYGTDKHEDYFVHMGERAQAGELPASELQHLHDELGAIAASGAMPPELRQAKDKVEAALAALPAAPTALSVAHGAA